MNGINGGKVGLSENYQLLERRARKLILPVLVIVALFLLASVAGAVVISGSVSAGSMTLPTHSQSISATPSATSWTYPTTTMQEPGYTNGTYVMASVNNVEDINIWLASDVYSFYLLDEIYDSPANIAPNNTLIPWLATGWTETNVTSQNMQTFSPITGNEQSVSYIWTVHIRPGVQWTDWTPSGASSTYVFSNKTSFSLYNFTTGATDSFTHQYKWPTATMQTYYVQSADFVLSWLMLSSALDYGGTYLNVVNVVPQGNLTVQYYLSAQSASFTDSVLLDPILPYHIWSQHAWSETQGAWNYTGAPNGYDNWNVGYNSKTGVATGLVGSGPFMMNGGYGMPTGNWNEATGNWFLIVNPHYFVQYTTALQRWTPKFYELSVPRYSSVSDAATAEKLGQVYTIEGGLPPTFIPTIHTMPNTYIYYKPAASFGYIQLNSRPQYAPLNITALRQALDYASNKAYISAVIDEGYNINGPNALPIADSVWYNSTDNIYAYNPQLALSMIKNISGMKQVSGEWYYFGTQVTITIQISPYSEDPLGVEAAEVIAQEWSAIGIKTTVEQMSFTTQVANTDVYAFQATDLGISGITGDPTSYFASAYNEAFVADGFYFGPYTNITINGVFYNTNQITDLVSNLSIQLNDVTNFSQRISIADQLQGIVDQEATMIGLGYPIDIIPFTNTTFTGVVRSTLGQDSFMYWNFLSLHLRSAPLKTPVAPPIQLNVGVVTQDKVYFNGMYGNATIEVRNQFGQPVSGANVVVGSVPSGPLVNITSNNGTTNSQGVYNWEFVVYSQNNYPFTSDYGGRVNISVTATLPGSKAVPGSGSTRIDISPYPVQYDTSGMPVVLKGSSPQPFTITVINPATGKPLSGYAYSVGVLSGAMSISSGGSGQTVSNLSSFNAFGIGNQPAYVTNPLAQAIVKGASAITLGPDGNLYVASVTGTVYALSPPSSGAGSTLPISDSTPYGAVVASYRVGSNPNALVFNGSGDLIVANAGSDNLTVISTGVGSVENVTLPSSPDSNALAEYNNSVYVGLANGNVVVLNESTWKIVATVTLNAAAKPEAFTWGPNGMLYAADFGNGTVSEINATGATTSLLAVMPAGTGPDALVFNGSGNLFAANYGSDNLTVYNLTGTPVQSVDVGTGPTAIAMDGSGFLYVSNALSDNVTIINDSASISTIANIGVGTFPAGMAYNSADGNVYITDTASNNLTVVSSATFSAIVAIPDFYVTTISGVTGSNGQINVMLSPSPIYNYTANGNNSSSYVFIGDYAAGGPLSGLSGFAPIAQLTSATNNNPINGPMGFGVPQPMDLPVELSTVAPSVVLSISANTTTIPYSGLATVSVRALNSTGAPVSNYPVTVQLQDALAANRGLLTNSSGSQVMLFNPNVNFASTFLPGIQLSTDANGYANVTFSPQLYNIDYSPVTGNFLGFSSSPYTDPYLIPFDEFQLSALGASNQSALLTINSTQFEYNPQPSPVTTPYLAGAQYIGGLWFITGNETYTLYINSTENNAAGPTASSVAATVNVTNGTLSAGSVNTGASGSATLQYKAANVTAITPVGVTVTTAYGTYSETFYIIPHSSNSTTTTSPTTKTKTVTSIPSYMYALVGVFAALFVISTVLFARARSGRGGKKQPPVEPEESEPEEGRNS